MDNFIDKLAQRLNAQEMIKANSAADAEKMKLMQMQIEEYDSALREMRKLGFKHAENVDKFNSLVEEVNQKIEKLTKESIDKIEAVKIKDDEIAQVMTKLKELEELLLADQKEMQEMSKAVGVLSKNNEENLKKIEMFSQKNEENFHKLEGFAQKNEENFRKIEELVLKNEENFYKMDEFSQKSDEALRRTEELFKKNEEYVHSEDVKVYRNVQAVVVEEAEKQTEIFAKNQRENNKKNKALLVVGVISLLGILADVFLNFAQLFNWKFF